VTQQAALKDANDNIDTSLQSAFRNNGTVNPQPIADQISTELASPAGKLPPVQTAMKTLTDALQKSDGTGMETDPRMVYGVRRVINYMQSKKGQLENPGYGDADVMAALQRVKQATDGAIEPAAPGFKQAIADYATARQAIDAKEALQAAEPKLYDNLGRMQYPAMHRFMNDVVQSRDPRAPLNPYQSLTDMQMARLKSIHDDLQRVASASDLAKASGSDTTQSLLSTLRSAAGGLPGTIAASVAGHVFGGPLGAILGGTAKQAISNVVSERAGQRNLAKMGTMLRPDPTQFPTTPNQLMPPP
jgi:hypothetical protein